MRAKLKVTERKFVRMAKEQFPIYSKKTLPPGGTQDELNNALEMVASRAQPRGSWCRCSTANRIKRHLKENADHFMVRSVLLLAFMSLTCPALAL